MSHRKVLLLVLVVLVLGAGVTVGRLSARLPEETAPRRSSGSLPWVKEQLNLSTQQEQQMDQIWAEAKARMTKTFEDQQALDRQRTEEVNDLLTPDQRVKYQAVMDQFHAQREALDKQRGQLIHDAVLKSKELLNDEQKTKWDELTQDTHDLRRGMFAPTTQPGPTTRPWP